MRLILPLLLMSINCFAGNIGNKDDLLLITEEKNSQYNKTKNTTSIRKEVEESISHLNILNERIDELMKESMTLTGSKLDVIALQLIHKNQTRRSLLSFLIQKNNKPYVDETFLLNQVNQQISFIEKEENFYNKKIERDLISLDKVKSSEKFNALKVLNDTQVNIIRTLNNELINYHWLKKLNQPTLQITDKFDKDLNKHLEFTKTSLILNHKTKEISERQFKKATADTSSDLELQALVASRTAEIYTNHLNELISLAEKTNIDTTEYKKILFEYTGVFTDQLLDKKVIMSMATSWFNNLIHWFVNNGPQLLFKIFIISLILMLFTHLRKLIRFIINHIVSSKNFNISMVMQNFLISISGNIILTVGILFSLSQLGINLTPLLTSFGILGLIIGIGLQNILANFASGVMLLIYRPFDIGDYVQAGQVIGTVNKMSLVNTTIKTTTNEIIIIPNNNVWNNTITNITQEKVRRVDLLFHIEHSNDISKTENILYEITNKHNSVLKLPEVKVRLNALTLHSTEFIVQAWVKSEDYWDVYWDITKEVKIKFDAENISLPSIPSMPIHNSATA
ncbi:mechanosensitive ion channel family protein [Photobacterium kishitanii]|uniref:mechanosensitive ion channel family protein n=1 Tax=Photobacterium kishitanii TaxID=318456 RepID=UPI000432AF60|nr:mechanosensitive ion channel domain-containing protein [Photobacterium kishitanii]CEO38805.1 Mechanosensitive ion channel family protein [Photobacterium kishitanii]